MSLQKDRFAILFMPSNCAPSPHNAMQYCKPETNLLIHNYLATVILQTLTMFGKTNENKNSKM